MSNIKEMNGKPRQQVSATPIFGVWPNISCGSVARRPQTIPLAMITTRKSVHGFPFLSYMNMGLCLAALRDAG